MSDENEEVCLHLKEGDESVLFHEYTTTELALSRDFDLSHSLEPVENTIKKYLEKKVEDFGEHSLEYFLKKIIPNFTNTLLKRGVYVSKTAEQVSQFIELVLQVICYNLESKWIEFIDTLLMIFSYDVGFYEVTSADEVTIEEIVYEYAEPKEQFSTLSPYLIHHINVFGSLGGFNQIINIIESPDIDMNAIKLLVFAIAKVRELFTAGFINDYIPKLHQSITNLIQPLSDEQIKNFDSNNIQDLIQNMSCIYAFYDKSKAEEIYDNLALSLTLKCFKSPYLTVRLAGLNDIKNFISRVESKKPQMRHFRDQREEAWLTSEYLANWIKENNILELLYKYNIHLELLRRCVEIPIFLAQEECLSTKDIDLIWAGVEKHETIANSIYASLSTLANHLEINLVNHLFNLIQNVPLQKLDGQLIHLLRTVSIIGIPFNHLSQQPHFYGLEIMWNVVQDDVAASYEVKEEAMQFIQEFIYCKDCYEYRIPLILKAIENLKNHRSSCSSMKVLEKILNSYPELSNASENVISIIQWLEVEYNLTNLLLKDLENYNLLVKKYLEENDFIRNHPEYWNTTSFSGNSSHLREVTDRIEFIAFVVKKSMITFNQDQFDTIWKCVIKEALTKEVHDTGLKWFNTLSESSDFEPFSEIALYIFENKLTELDIPNLSSDGLELIYAFFKYINLSTEMLQSDPVYEHEFVVCSSELTGINFIREIALTVIDPDVAKQAIGILLDLQNCLSPDLLPHVRSLRELFIKFYMDQITEATKEKLTKRTELRINRCLIIIKSFIDKFDPKTEIKRHGSIGKGTRLTVNIIPAFKQFAPFKVEIFRNDTIGTLKEKVAQVIKAETGVRLTTAGKELVLDQQTVGAAGISNGQSINVTTRSTHIRKLRQIQKEEQNDLDTAPSNILSNPVYFDQLFQLLSLEDDSIGQKVWDLLMILPTNKEILGELQKNETPNWDSILSTQSLYRLLYLLQIIESNVDTNNSTGEEMRTKLNWSSWFLENGGVDYLLAIVCQGDLLKSQRAKSITCIGLILQIVAHFTSKSISVISVHEPAVLVDRVLEIILRTSGEIASPENEKIVHFTFEFFEHCCAREDILLYLINYQNFNEWLYKVLLSCTDTKVREHVTKFLTNLYEKYPTVNGIALLDIFFNYLYPFLTKIDSNCSTSDHYFELLNNVIVSIRLERDLAEKYDDKFESVLSDLIAILIEHPIVETDSSTEDSVLIGLLKVICTLVCAHKQFKNKFGDLLIDQLYHKCLFEFPTLRNPSAPVCKCKSNKSRSIAFELLYETVENHPQNLWNLASKLINNHLTFPQNLWQYAPSRLERSNCGYVGLRNLGATCYMNSLMQQFFMIPKFRKGFLTLPNPDPDNLDDNLLYQMQKLFLNLQESQKKYYNTIGFCNSYKENGQPINPSNQMDADEFFNMLFEKLENALKGTNRESFFRDFFGGKVCNQVISKECDHVSENFEDFYTISVAVKGKNSLSESLDLFIECDILEGDNKYECSKCNSKVDALKRCCIAELPNNLIIHMRRFEFDFEEMRRMKVNDHCQFPMHLNMEPYTKEGLARKEAEKEGKVIPESQKSYSYYQYELAGILVHHGTAESGHYYSFIKDRDNSIWYQFNDKVVDYFDERDISRSCFGGYENFTEFDSSLRKHVQNVRQREDNAYMLFYQRVQQEKVASDEITLEPNSFLDQTYQSIWQENIQFFADKYLFDTNYFSFLYTMLKPSLPANLQYDAPIDVNTPSFKCIELATRFFSHTLTHSKEKDILGNFLELLKEKFANDIPACKWFITTAVVDNWAKQFLVNCPVEESRDAFSSLISHVLKCLSPFEREFYDEQIDEPDLSYYVKRDSKEMVITSSDDFEVSSESESIEGIIFIGHIPDVTPKSFCIWMIEHISSQLKYLRHNWRYIDQYFRVFKEFVKIGNAEKKYLLGRSIVSRFIDFYIGDDSPLSVHLNVNRSNIGDKFTKANVSSMIETISDLVCSTIVNNDHQKQLISDSFPGYTLSNLDKQFLLSDSFYTRLLSDGMNSSSTASLVTHMIFEDERASRSFLKNLHNSIFTASDNDLAHYFTIITAICNLEDSHKDWRTQFITTILVRLAEYCGSKFVMSTYHIVQYFTKIIHLPIVNQWMTTNLNEWLGKWLISNSYDQVRFSTEELVHNMLLISETLNEDGTKVKVYDEERRHQILRELLELLSLAARNAKREPFHLPIQNSDEYSIDSLVEEYSFECSPWKLVEYFRLMSWCIHTKEDIELFFEYYEDHFLPLWTKIDLINDDSDENKAQMTKLLYRTVQDYVEYCQYLLASDASVNRLLTYYICLKQSEHDRYYNNHTLAIFFNIILQCCRYSENFLSTFIHHHNFSWNFAYIYMPNDYQLTSDVIFEIMKLTVEARDLRHIQIYLHLNHKDRAKYDLKNVFRSLNTIIVDEEDAIYFCKEGGLDYLSQINELQAEDLNFDPDAVSIVESTLTLLAKVTEWFCDGQYDKEMLEVKQNWELTHELFPILHNFLETSLIDSILNSTFKILHHLSAFDTQLLEKTVAYLHIEHENYYCSLYESESEDFVNGPRRPCMRAHLPSFSGKDFFDQHEEYYSFATQICRFAVDKLLGDKQKAKIVLELILFVTIETIPSSGLHATLIDLLETILDSAHFASTLLRESKYLDFYVVKVLTSETQLLELDDCYQFIKRIFPMIYSRLSEEFKDSIVTSFSLSIGEFNKELNDNQECELLAHRLTRFFKATKLFLLNDELKEMVTAPSSSFGELSTRLHSGNISFPETPNYVLEDLQSALVDLLEQ